MATSRSPSKPTDSPEEAKKLENEGDALESKLAASSAHFRSQRQLPSFNNILPQVTAALPRDGALIEFLSFDAQPVVPPLNTPPAKIPHTAVYLALILLPSGDIRVADLGPAAPIDRVITELNKAISERSDAYLAKSQELYRLVFQPIAPHVATQRRLYISPDGQINLVPFAALHDGTRFVADAYELTYLTSGKDLLQRNREASPSQTVAVFAPFASDDSATTALPATDTTRERSLAVQRLYARNCSELKRTWLPLPGTRKEAELLHTLFPDAQLLLGPAATRDAFLNVAAPGILHVPTHGFFMADCQPKTPAQTRGILSTVNLEASHTPVQASAQPLIRSGLLMADRTSFDDAIVTALEIGAMNLWGTQLVVLSACDTGRGDIKLSQGVFGLRRAFVIAGAETVVSSLWRVDDASTQELMASFYRNLLAGHGRSQAMRMAAAALRAKYPHPYYWAPFIVVGNDAPLRGFGIAPAAGTSQ